ncbi:Zinc carboxypeptidase [Nocardioides terrae]|uniref:Zinc carboxypeptidase n=1 Tax=Nocardioides terrae TaxID=574651 RepID=A0A1I1DX57_9ACTN|nr:M14 family zinc carboxypeptidase [Nocardioides terrae]SFB77300.1 Zinc carboxypeptidase [Nocardioides terrae]
MGRMPRVLAKLLLPLLLPLLLVVGLLDLVASPPADAGAAPARPAVLGVSVIGHSAGGRPIRAWHLGTPGARKVVLVSTMHGDESRAAEVLTSLRDGRAVRGIDLWVVPTYNPDGKARHTRQNARGVDLNRNYPTSWRRVGGRYDSGRAPGSEPETKAMMRFLSAVRPAYVVSFHQPLDGVDTLTKHPAFSRRLAHALRLPVKTFSCNGGCHGTMTMWFNKHFPGQAVTAEFGAHPSRRELRGPVVRRLLRLFHARR